MPQLTVKVKDRRGTVHGGLDRRIKQFVDAEQRARTMAARAATTSTRANVTYRRDIIPPRPGRSSTGGRMKQALQWEPKNGMVEFDMAKADREAPHWIIQNVGTGRSATLKKANVSNPTGRPKKGATYKRRIPSQVGRPIAPGLVFATGGRYSQPGSRRNEQLHLISSVSGAPTVPVRMRIQKEIPPQRFVQRGGEHGFREYKQGVLAAARQAFKKSNRP